MAESSNEMFYLDADGNKQDAELHAEMLDNPEADEDSAMWAVLKMIDEGGSEADALHVYGLPGTPARLAAYRAEQAAEA